jgi:signal transduction histidine kinase
MSAAAPKALPALDYDTGSMARRSLRLQHRIVIPFAIVALAATLAVSFVALTVISRTLQARAINQVQNTASVISHSEFALNPNILKSVHQLTGADVITYTRQGAILASTLDERAQHALIDAVATSAAAEDAYRSAGRVFVRSAQCAAPCFVAYTQVTTRPETVVAVIAQSSDLIAATSALTRAILIAATLSVLVMVLVSQVVARRVTAPLNALVAFTRDVSPTGSTQRAQIGDDEVGRLAAAFNDMLDRLDRSRDALVRSEKLALAGLIAARVAHDVRNPLSSMKIQAQLLDASLGDNAPGRKMLGAVLRDIQQLESVVRDLIELARPGELHREPTSIGAVVDEVLQQLSAQLAYRKIVVEARLPASQPLVDLDVARFRQVLLNLIGNAADAMPTGGTLTITTEGRDAGSAVVLDICDDGVGIDPAIRDRVFDPFVSTKRDGVGLGLVNAKAVVESHGGTLELAAQVPKGTRARIVLPASRAAYQESAHG